MQTIPKINIHLFNKYLLKMLKSTKCIAWAGEGVFLQFHFTTGVENTALLVYSGSLVGNHRRGKFHIRPVMSLLIITRLLFSDKHNNRKHFGSPVLKLKHNVDPLPPCTNCTSYKLYKKVSVFPRRNSQRPTTADSLTQR